MNRTTSITLAAILVVATVAVPFAAASVASSNGVQDETDAGEANESIKPGERFAAAVGVQNAELEGNVSERAFGVRIANAESNGTKAAIVAEHHETADARLGELEDRLETLNESREAGNLSEGRYRAEVAETVAEMRSIEQRATTAETTAAELPPEALAANDIDLESIRTLRERAGELDGPDTAAIARSIAGDDVGRSSGSEPGVGGPSDGPADDRPGGQAGDRNGTVAGPNGE
ncbi:hypothetical protein [Natrinema versiforme]|uniref:Uncharacterized protein n=1 Tax=Natrinema versiforme JCM 10478 TaxID=1227496 RepID=L9XVX2_9EURY|nr:hypothetical protein [Natrinema versiforme]ELY65915.1 hypothetical protein C489_13678 [Natrinema versiforme JCM 10478]